jgi:trimeric autotransporter adhesin
MSTKTTFKRIALVAVAALGLGVLSVAPSSAVVSSITLTAGAGGTSSNSAEGFTSDSSTAATFTVSALIESADSVTVTFVQKSVPSGSSATARMYFYDTTTPVSNSTRVDTTTSVSFVNNSDSATANTSRSAVSVGSAIDSWTGITAGSNTVFRMIYGATGGSGTYGVTATGYAGAKFGIQLDSATSRIAGTYTYTVVVKTYEAGNSSVAAQTQTLDVSIVVAATTTSAKTVNAANSFARLNATQGVTTAGVDDAIQSVSTASATPVGYVYVGVRNTANATNAAQDSITATITGAGLLSRSGVTGTSFKIAATGDAEFSILPDGRAGVGTITITTNGTSYSPKTVVFYAKSAKTITATVAHPTLKVGANTGAVSVAAVDANGTEWRGTAYIVASAAADALVAGSATTPVQCAAWNATDGILCPVTAIAAGTAKLKVIDASTVALATATSNEITVKSSSATANTVKIAFDKATYAPFEKATITVTPVDVAGNALATNTWSNLLATGGITSTIGFSANSDTLTAVAYTTDPETGSVAYTVYMPAGSGDVTISATGGTSLPAAGQVKVSATAAVVNSSVDAATDAANEATDAANAATDAALAAADAADAATAAAQDASDAVAALSASVSKLISSLRAQITSLTNLVIKIQKKVRA